MYWILFPFSFLYGIVISVRNKLFDWKIIKTKRFNKPVICIGNITVGGTGKTPHTEYLIRQLKNDYSLAILSRGYKRKTKGFISVTKHSKVDEVGDEPLQIKRKFNDIEVAVDEDRAHGIETIFSKKNAANVVILDDAFQHRKVTAGFRVLLTDYNRLLTSDYLMPVGRLREHRHNKKRAHCVIITKCPNDLKPFDYRILTKKLDLFPYQTLCFTTFTYKRLIPLKGTKVYYNAIDDLRNKELIVVTGIANPKPLYKMLKSLGAKVHKVRFADHHQYSKHDLEKVQKKYNHLEEAEPLVICTEKDAVKFNELLSQGVHKAIPFYYLPIEVEFLNGSGETFNNQLHSFISN